MDGITITAQTTTLLDALCEKVGIAVDWTSANIWPEIQAIAAKFVAWESGTSILWLILGIVIFLIGVGAFIIVGRSQDIEEFECICCVIGIMAIIVSIPIVVSQVTDLITCAVFPEKVIFDYLSTFIK